MTKARAKAGWKEEERLGKKRGRKSRAEKCSAASHGLRLLSLWRADRSGEVLPDTPFGTREMSSFGWPPSIGFSERSALIPYFRHPHRAAPKFLEPNLASAIIGFDVVSTLPGLVCPPYLE